MSVIAMFSKTTVIRYVRYWVTIFIPISVLRGLLNLPRYFRSWYKYKVLSRNDLGLADIKVLASYPCLNDGTTNTPFDPHYFFQGAWLARQLTRSKPEQHVDVGSSVIMIGAISAIVKTIFIDFRPLNTNLDGLTVLAGDITKLPFASNSLLSLSSLHVIEHIGLGRYGDPIDPQGSTKGARELMRVLAPGGLLYLSTPIGRERIEFNAHRVFAPQSVIELFDGLELLEFTYIDDTGSYLEQCKIEDAMNSDYACGLYLFRKHENR